MRGRSGRSGIRRGIGHKVLVLTAVVGMLGSDALVVDAAPAPATPIESRSLSPLPAGGVNELTPKPVTGDFDLLSSVPDVPSTSAPAPQPPVNLGPPAAPSLPVTLTSRPSRVRELIAERSEFSSVWLNDDGSNTAVISPEPVHYRGPRGDWLPVDNRVVDTGGVLGNAANSWSVRFGPLGAGGLSYRMPSGRAFSIEPVGATSGVTPTVDRDDPNAVIYRNAWPGVDLRYVVHGSGVREDIVLHSSDVPASFEFRLIGGLVVPDPRTGGATGVGGLEGLTIPAPEPSATLPGRSPWCPWPTRLASPTAPILGIRR